VFSFFERWRHVVMEILKVSYKVKMELIYILGITKTNNMMLMGFTTLG
jgi:hypothetical protein